MLQTLCKPEIAYNLFREGQKSVIYYLISCWHHIKSAVGNFGGADCILPLWLPWQPIPPEFGGWNLPLNLEGGLSKKYLSYSTFEHPPLKFGRWKRHPPNLGGMGCQGLYAGFSGLVSWKTRTITGRCGHRREPWLHALQSNHASLVVNAVCAETQHLQDLTYCPRRKKWSFPKGSFLFGRVWEFRGPAGEE